MAPFRPKPGDTTQRPQLQDDDDEASVAKTTERPEFKPSGAQTVPNPILPPKRKTGEKSTAKAHMAETAPNPVISPRPIPDTAPAGTSGSRRDLLIDTTVSGYRVEGVLGKGAAGIVYKAQHLINGRKAAFKVLKPEFADDAEYIRRLVEEAKSLTAIRHKGIIDILDFGALPNGQPYLVMELCDGLSLEEQLKFGGQPTINETLVLLDELFDALGAAHERGIIHRDLKPSNLFLATYADGTRVLKVLDFGLPRRSDGKGSIRPTMPGTMVGTPDYMAPEQIKGEKMGTYSDLYAVGGIAFRLLTNRLPFIGNSGIAVISKKMEQPPPHPRDLDPKIAPELDELVFRLLNRDPRLRPTLKDAREGFAAYRASLRRGPIPSLLDEDPSTGPTAFHDFHRGDGEREHVTLKQPLNAQTEIALRPPYASPPARPTDLELQVPHVGPRSSSAHPVHAPADTGGTRWLMWVGIALVTLSVSAVVTWFIAHR